VPFAMPRGALTAADVAARTLASIKAGHDGLLDLTV
jgi:hypothetical protein